MKKTRSNSVNTTCGICNRQCGLRLGLKDGKLVSIAGMKEHPVSIGYTCIKADHARDTVYAPDRLRHPLRRIGERGESKWEKLPWNVALRLVAERMLEIKDKYGAHAFCLYMGAFAKMGTLLDLAGRFMDAYGSPNLISYMHLCRAPSRAASYYMWGGSGLISDYNNSACIVEWGANPARSQYPSYRNILRQKRRGAKLIVIDPYLTKMASQADHWLQPRPGADGALAIGMIKVIIDEGLFDHDFVHNWTVGFTELQGLTKRYSLDDIEHLTWVPKSKIVEAARVYAKTKPACIHDGAGLDMHTNTMQNLRAIEALRAITGNLDVPGGDLIPSFPTAGLRLPQESRSQVTPVGKYPLFDKWLDVYSANDALEAVLTGDPYPIKGMIIQAANPLPTLANAKRVEEALRKLEFLVVIDLFMTPTAQLADIVLPSASCFEETSLPVFAPRRHYVLLQRKAIEPVGGCWPDYKILLDLAKEVGYGEYFPWSDSEEIIDQRLAPSGITTKALKDNGTGIGFERLYRKYQDLGFKTPSGKLEFYSLKLKEAGHDPLPDYVEPKESPVSRPDLGQQYPLIASAGPKKICYTHTQGRNIPQLRRLSPEPFVYLHPDDAAPRNIIDLDRVVVSSARNKITMRAKLDSKLLKGVAYVDFGWSGDSNANLLVDDKETDPICGATAQHSFLCQVQKAL